jgi:hypothetical protein
MWLLFKGGMMVGDIDKNYRRKDIDVFDICPLCRLQLEKGKCKKCRICWDCL